MMAVAVVIGAGVVGLAVLLSREFRAARERDLVIAMESVLCSGGACDIESALA